MHFKRERKRCNPKGIHAELYKMYCRGVRAYAVILRLENFTILQKRQYFQKFSGKSSPKEIGFLRKHI